MRDIPGWVSGAIGVSALVGAFYLGGRVGATAPNPGVTDRATAAELAGTNAAAPQTVGPPPTGLQVQCEPGQRAVVGTSGPGAAPTVSCVSDATPVQPAQSARSFSAAPVSVSGAEVFPVHATAPPMVARPAVLSAPTEVYQPRPRRTVHESRGEAAPSRRTWERSAVIIGSSAAVGATVGGLTKGKKGALIGGIVGGGAATVWDQVTRRGQSHEGLRLR